jgi:allantoinase
VAADLVVRARRAVVDGVEVAACVEVTGERITAVTPYDEPPAADRTVDLGDDEVLLPGLVDTHVHVNEPGRTEWEGFATATRAAAAGGVTTILDMPLNSVPPTTTVEHLRVKQAAAERQVAVDVGFWGGAVPGNVPDLEPLHEAGVFGFKCFLLDSGVEEFGHLDPVGFAEAMRETARIGALMVVHAEDGDLLDEGALDGTHYAGFLASRPRAAEEAAIGRVVGQAEQTGGRAHVVHLSDADAVPALRAARAAGVDVSVETCPHYLTFDAEHIADGATELKCCPPIREADNREALWAAVRWMATAPADRVGLAHKGRIAVGADADLVRFAPGEEFTVDVARLHHRNPVSAYAGRRLAGVVRETWLRGVPVSDESPRGRLLRRGER